MTADLQNKLQAQKGGANQNGYIQGITNKEMQVKIKNAAKAIHKSNKAAKSKGIVYKAIGPLVNGLYTG